MGMEHPASKRRFQWENHLEMVDFPLPRDPNSSPSSPHYLHYLANWRFPKMDPQIMQVSIETYGFGYPHFKNTPNDSSPFDPNSSILNHVNRIFHHKPSKLWGQIHHL